MQFSKPLFFGILLMLLGSSLSAQQKPAQPNWDSLKFLIGKWIGEGTSGVAQGSGYFTFELDLQGRTLVRKNRSVYPATADRAAVTQEDLMIVYFEPGTGLPRAFFIDSEGNVINYAVNLSTDAKTVVFISEDLPGTPRYRLTYILTQPDKMTLTFEVAPPAPAGLSTPFKKFIEGTVHRAPAGK